jgi:beta-hydroxylase
MIEHLLQPKFVVLYLFLLSVLYVHFRGRVRHKFHRQLVDHSAFLAPYNVLMYFFSAVRRSRSSICSTFPI